MMLGPDAPVMVRAGDLQHEQRHLVVRVEQVRVRVALVLRVHFAMCWLRGGSCTMAWIGFNERVVTAGRGVFLRRQKSGVVLQRGELALEPDPVHDRLRAHFLRRR